MLRSFAGPKDREEIDQESHHRESADRPPSAHEGPGHPKQKPVQKEEGEFDKGNDNPEEWPKSKLEANVFRQILLGRLFPMIDYPRLERVIKRKHDCIRRHISNQKDQSKAMNVVIRFEGFHRLQSNRIPPRSQDDPGIREDPGEDLVPSSVKIHKVQPYSAISSL